MGKDDVILSFILNSSFNLFIIFIIFISHCDMKMLIMMPAVAGDDVNVISGVTKTKNDIEYN